MRKLLLFALASVFVAGTALAGPDSQSNQGSAAYNKDVQRWAKFEGANVLNSAGVEIGEIDRIAKDRQTGEIVAIVGLQGMTGDNMKEVPIPIAKLSVIDEDNVRTSLTKDELQARHDADPWEDRYKEVEEAE